MIPASARKHHTAGPRKANARDYHWWTSLPTDTPEDRRLAMVYIRKLRRSPILGLTGARVAARGPFIREPVSIQKRASICRSALWCLLGRHKHADWFIDQVVGRLA